MKQNWEKKKNETEEKISNKEFFKKVDTDTLFKLTVLINSLPCCILIITFGLFC